jgi:hypothetical protein
MNDSNEISDILSLIVPSNVQHDRPPVGDAEFCANSSRLPTTALSPNLRDIKEPIIDPQWSHHDPLPWDIEYSNKIIRCCLTDSEKNGRLTDRENLKGTRDLETPPRLVDPIEVF